MAVSKRTRFEVFKRDGFTCQYCGRTPPTVVLECDHVEAVANGGSDDEANLVTSCFDCNRGKSDVPLTTAAPGVRERLDREREIEEQVRQYNELLSERRRRQDDEIDEIGRYWFNQFEEKRDAYVFGVDRVPSIRTFLRKLPKTEILEAVDIAHSRKPVRSTDYATWKYFCGVCWKKIRDREEQDA